MREAKYSLLIVSDVNIDLPLFEKGQKEPYATKAAVLKRGRYKLFETEDGVYLSGDVVSAGSGKTLEIIEVYDRMIGTKSAHALDLETLPFTSIQTLNPVKQEG